MAALELTQHFHIFPQCVYIGNIFLKVGPCRTFQQFSDFVPNVFVWGKHFLEGVALQNLPTTFRISRLFPTKKHFLEGVALHNLPTTSIIYPPLSEFTHHLQNLPTHLQKQIGVDASGPFCTFVDLFVDPNNVRFDKHDSLVSSIN